MKTSRALVLTGLVVLSAVLASAEVAVTEDGVEKADTAAESLEISHCIDSVVFGLNLTNFPCMKLVRTVCLFFFAHNTMLTVRRCNVLGFVLWVCLVLVDSSSSRPSAWW